MAVVYTLTHGTTRRTLAAWGIKSARLVTISQGIDTLSVTLRRDAAALPFAYLDDVILYRDEVVIFRGIVTKPADTGTARKEELTYTISGPWWYLTQSAYLQDRVTFGLITDLAAPPAPVATTTATSRVTLGMGAAVTAPITNGAEITRAVQYAIDTYGIPVAVGTISVALTVPYEEKRDITVAEVINLVLRLTPDAVVYWDYSTTVPTLQVRKRSGLTPVSIALDGGALVTDWSCMPRHDLVPSGVLFLYEQPVNVQESGIWKSRVQVFSETGGAGGTQLGAIVYTFQLQGSALGYGNGEPVPVGLAAAYYASLSLLQYEGEITLRDSTGLLGLGQVLNLTGDRTEWATMQALLQSVEYDLLAGTVRASFGPPNQLGPQDFSTLMGGNRQNSNPSNYPMVQNTGAPVGGPNPVPDVPPGNLEAQVISAIGTLVGYSEFTSPSLPPKKYRVRTWSGSVTGSSYTGSPCVTLSCTATDVLSGTDSYSATTGALTIGASRVRTGSCGDSGTSVPTDITAGFNDVITLTQTEKARTNPLTCSGTFKRLSAPTDKIVLSDEDTEADAIARTNAGTSWVTGAAGSVASMAARAAGVFTFVYQAVRVRALWTADPTRTYTITIRFGRRVAGSADSFAAFSEEVLTVLADTANETSDWVNVPNAYGYETKCTSVTVELVP